MEINNKELKLQTIHYFLTEILNPKYPLESRKKELDRVFGKLNGFPELSDIWGSELNAIDKISLRELRLLLDEYDNYTFV